MDKPTPITTRVLATVEATPGLTSKQIAGRLGLPQASVQDRLSAARSVGRVQSAGPKGSPYTTWHIAGAQTPPPLIPTPPNRLDRMSGTYTCPELYAPPSRPGAMDAYRLPSRGACDGGRP